jgi:hypothetical protein
MKLTVPPSFVALTNKAAGILDTSIHQAKQGLDSGVEAARTGAAQAAGQALSAYRETAEQVVTAYGDVTDQIATAYRETKIAGVPVSDLVSESAQTGATVARAAANAVGNMKVGDRPIKSHLAAAGNDIKDAARNALLRQTRNILDQQEQEWSKDIERILRGGIIADNSKEQCIAYLVNNHLAPVFGDPERDQEHAILTLSVLREAYARNELSAEDFKRILMDFEKTRGEDLRAAKALARSYLYAVRRGKIPV